MSPDRVPANKTAALKRATLVDFWFLRVMPNSVAFKLSNHSYSFARKLVGNERADSFSISREVVKWTGLTHLSDLLGYSMSESRQLMSRAQFDQLLADEANRPASGQYVFAHLLIPHGPWTVDDRCEAIPKKQDAANGQAVSAGPIAATVCATRLVARLAARLQELGRLQNSLIVVQSDHGDPLGLRGDKDGSVNRAIGDRGQMHMSLPQFMHYWSDNPDWPSELVELSSSSLLAIKFPDSKNYETTEVPSAVIDIAPTILAHFGADASKFPGVALQGEPNLSVRPREFFAVTRQPFKVAKFQYRDGAWQPVPEGDPIVTGAIRKAAPGSR
jgi:hypothetical protein